MPIKCKGICHRIRYWNGREESRYGEDKKLCKCCHEYFKTKDIRCICCSARLRTSPRHTFYKHKHLERLIESKQ